MFIAALFTIAKTWKMWCLYVYVHIYIVYYTYTHTIEYYSAIKNNEIMTGTATWMDPEIIILSKVSQTEKHNYHMTYLWNL